MIEVKTELNRDVQKELAKTHTIVTWCMLIVGAIGSLIYIFSDFIFGVTQWTEYLIVFVLPLGLGIGLLIFIKRNLKAVDQVNNVNCYSFDLERVTIVTLRNNENVGEVKVYYKDLVKTKETEKYFFLYINAVSAFPVLKANLTVLEQSEIRMLLNIKNKQLKKDANNKAIVEELIKSVKSSTPAETESNQETNSETENDSASINSKTSTDGTE